MTNMQNKEKDFIKLFIDDRHKTLEQIVRIAISVLKREPEALKVEGYKLTKI